MIVPAASSEEKISLITYLASKIGTSPQALVGQMPFEVVAVTRQGRPMGAVLYINYRVETIEMACAGESGWLTPGNLRSLFAYPFEQLGVHAVLSMVKKSNKAARKFNRDLGFRELCLIPQSPTGENDTILHCMTKTDCRWMQAAKVIAIPDAPQKVYAHG